MKRSGPPTSGPDRSIRKSNVPSGSGPSGHYRRNGLLPSGVEGTGPSGPVSPRPARLPAGHAWQADRRGESADFRRRRTCRASTMAGSGQVDFAGRVRSGRSSAGPGTGAVLFPRALGQGHEQCCCKGGNIRTRETAPSSSLCAKGRRTQIESTGPPEAGSRSEQCSRKMALPGCPQPSPGGRGEVALTAPGGPVTGPGTTAGSAHRRRRRRVRPWPGIGLGSLLGRGAPQGLGHELVERAPPPSAIVRARAERIGPRVHGRRGMPARRPAMRAPRTSWRCGSPPGRPCRSLFPNRAAITPS